jgi:hypothetical protein
MASRGGAAVTKLQTDRKEASLMEVQDMVKER